MLEGLSFIGKILNTGVKIFHLAIRLLKFSVGELMVTFNFINNIVNLFF